MSLYIMDTLEISTQCRVRQCFQCQEDTEFYCNTCKHGLCLQCKERHTIINLDTIYHDVVIYREKYGFIPKQEPCERHTDMFYKKYCHSCKIPLCFQCPEHRHHQTLRIRTAYRRNRKKHREIIHKIRSETLYNSCCLLAGIKADMKICHTEISNRQSEMLLKAQKLRNPINIVIFDQIANRPIKFIMLLKRTRVHKIKDTPSLTRCTLICLIEEINIEEVTDLLFKIQLIETGKRQVRNESLLKLMSTPVLHRCFTVSDEIHHISVVTTDQVLVSDGKNLILINSEGDILSHLTDVISVLGQHTVNLTGDVIYIDRGGNIIKLSKDFRTKSTLIKKTEQWVPQCIYSSQLNGDLLIGMHFYHSCLIARYNDTGQNKQTIQHGNTGQELYSYPICITENRNGDVVVSDIDGDHGSVVVTERGGRHRFSYTGHPRESRFFPLGICTDALSHILVCNFITRTIHIIDRDGHFLSMILTRRQGMSGPMCLSYDDKTHLLWVGLRYGEKRVCVYRYIARQDYLQYITSKIDT
ncbi:uncharacterized protein LOC134244150 [Saccostrea cucullata]|uniref:uncharacterized protein LOC134244150 n=1 Tax=Saccostrea cuccullata TaxID=36930 RepID=UPI002ED383A3